MRTAPCNSPAQLTKAAAGPGKPLAKAETSSSELISSAVKRTDSPSSAARAAPASAFRSAIMTDAPPAAKRRTQAAPIPLAPPDTTTLPSGTVEPAVAVALYLVADAAVVLETADIGKEDS